MMSGNDGLAGEFHNRGHLRTFADISGHSCVAQESKGAWRCRVEPEFPVPRVLFSHKLSCCLSGFIGFIHVQ